MALTLKFIKIQSCQPRGSEVANGHAEGDWKRDHPREDKRIPLEDAEGRTGCSRVRNNSETWTVLSMLPASSYGHGVLRSPDPRFIALQEFCETRPELKNSPSVNLVKQVRF